MTTGKNGMTPSRLREEPCPCGSGKTFGDCCFEKKQHILKIAKELNQMKNGDEEALEEQLFRCLEMSYLGSEDDEELIPVSDSMWSLRSVAKMDTQEIIEKLESMHIHFDKEQFKKQAESYVSSEKLADDFYYTQDYEPEEEEDFIWMAISELWKRFLPEKPTIEAIDEAIIDGYNEVENEAFEKALEKWNAAWDMLDQVFPLDITSTDQIMEMGDFCYQFSDWLVDFANINIDIGQKTTSAVTTRINTVEKIFSRFPDVDEYTYQQLVIAKAESLAFLGKREEAESLIHDILEQYPENARAYAVWGNMYWGEDNIPPDYEKAKEIYFTGISRCKPANDVLFEVLEAMNNQIKQENKKH